MCFGVTASVAILATKFPVEQRMVIPGTILELCSHSCFQGEITVPRSQEDLFQHFPKSGHGTLVVLYCA